MQTQQKQSQVNDHAGNEDRIIALLAEVANGNRKVTGEEPLAGLKQWDSLAALDFVMAVEQAFGVELSPDEMHNCQTVEDIVHLVASKVVD